MRSGEAQWLLIECCDGEKEAANYFLATLPENATKRQLIRLVMQRGAPSVSTRM